MTSIQTAKDLFRAGQHALAIHQCEALLLRHPADRELRRTCATMHGLVNNFARSLALLRELEQPGRRRVVRASTGRRLRQRH